jgi:hypothetical protein
MIIINHEVSDFSHWKTFFDADKPRRDEAGLSLVRLGTNTENSNEVTIIFETPDLKKAQEFMSGPDLQEVMQKAGVIRKPTVTFLNKM